MNILKDFIIMLPCQHIFLVSHMRANTSLFGHLLGSSDEISGYYEMHIGYYSWKSLIRQKMIYHKMNPNEPLTHYYFDKILHNEHNISDKILNNHNVQFIFMLREPEMTIKSICELYKKSEPNHTLATVFGASKYYFDRVAHIGDVIENIKDKNKCYYLDAENLILDTDQSLKFLSNMLGLKTPLSTEYKKFKFTGKDKFGDNSKNISSGYVVSGDKNRYKDITIDSEYLSDCQRVYEESRAKLMNLCHTYL